MSLREVRRVQESNKWGVTILSKPASPELYDKNPAQLDFSKLRSDDPIIQTKSHTFKGFKTENGSIEVTNIRHIPTATLSQQRNLRKLASGSSVFLNIASAIGLMYGSAKLFLSSSFGRGETDNAYKTFSKAYALGGAAGIMTGAAHESTYWTLGNLGMAAAGAIGLDTDLGLMSQTFSNGLSSLGMSAVRKRQNANSFAITKSIFNNEFLYPLRFLQPIEQAVYSFFSVFKSKDRLLSFQKEKPYQKFQRTSGGLISASSFLGIANLFKEKIPEKISSFAYLLYAVLSSADVYAFGSDGKEELWKVNSIAPDTQGENVCRHVEGYTKLASTPFLGINNFFLALKGLGIETVNNGIYHTAMAFRSVGVGLAMLGFAAQSMIKFFRPTMFGPVISKEIWDIDLNPTLCLANTFEAIEKAKNESSNTHNDEEILETSKTFMDILLRDPRYNEGLKEIINSNLFQESKNISHCGLPSYSNPQSHSTVTLKRFHHALGVAAFSVLTIKELINNAPTKKIKDDVTRHEIAYVVANLIHDLGHLARSHVLEKVIEGHKDYEELIHTLENKDSEISQIITRHFGADTLKMVLYILGQKHPLLHKAHKDNDRQHYQGFYEYTRLKNPRLKFYKATIDDVVGFAKSSIPFVNSDGKTDMSYTPSGAIQKLNREFARYMYFSTEHGAFQLIEADVPYCIGLKANPNVTITTIKAMTENDVDRASEEGIRYIKNGMFEVILELVSGGRSYVGYDPQDKNTCIWVNTGNSVMEITDWAEKVLKKEDKDLYKDLKKKITILTAPREIRIRARISNRFGDQTKTQVVALSNRITRNKYDNVPKYSMST